MIKKSLKQKEQWDGYHRDVKEKDEKERMEQNTRKHIQPGADDRVAGI